MVNSKMKLILASASPRRKELLSHLKVPFEIKTLNIPEESSETDPLEYAREISVLKGEAVFKKTVEDSPDDSFMIISADTIVCLEGKIFGKPKSKNEARSFLEELSGKTHSVFTAVAIHVRHDRQSHLLTFVEESKVTFSPISEDLMENYLDTGDSLDKAGAYGIQGPSLTFISKVEGDYANVVGFPLSRFIQESKSFLKNKFPNEDLWQKLL